jgi:hypothetical protein
MFFVKIENAKHRNQKVPVDVYPVVKDYDEDKGQMTILTDGKTKPFQVKNARIKLDEGDFFYCNKDGEAIDPDTIRSMQSAAGEVETDEAAIAEFLANESEDDAMERIGKQFQMLERITDASARGIVRGLVVSGPPGIGKSFGVYKQLAEANLTRKLADDATCYDIVKGTCTAIALYQSLYLNRHKGFVTVFDDCDDILFDDTCLNMLKAALDSGNKRILSYRAESRVLKEADIPDSFEFEGSIIFLTNLDFEALSQSDKKKAMHLGAIVSRCHYLDLEISTQRDQLLRIKQIVRAGMLDEFEFENGEEQMIVDWIFQEANYLRELSLRMVKKIADFVAAEPNNWEDFAVSTCLRKDARYRRMLEAKKES